MLLGRLGEAHGKIVEARSTILFILYYNSSRNMYFLFCVKVYNGTSHQYSVPRHDWKSLI